ncbi:FecR family protein [Niastella sp. OAS944]|uniref:FecR family protein n=1 Tax=Niastella sp. OAS944 TaxID=2664089 RepID=UPI00346D5AD9|nr:ferric-dicitrate binding protein FerR (iron transport regulator) [Chitinophagaceae bacterium OAS944]
MSNSEQLDDLITRHFCNELNSDEQAKLLQWLSASEENRQYYEALKNTWQLMKDDQTPDEINANKEWAYFQHALQQDSRGERDYTGDITGKRGLVRKIVITTAIAASVLLIITVGYKWWGSDKSNNHPVVASVKKDSATNVVVRHEINTSGKTQRIVLTDSSEVLLDPLSEITWNEPFTNNKRNIVLKGRARFNVAKDKTKPFTVISGHLATTALGTQFIVTAFEQDEFITVQLYEGRVVVKPADSLQPKLKKEFYLVPGEELLYSNKQNTASVRRFINDNTALKKGIRDERGVSDQPSLPVDKGSWYMFNNQPLTQVFKQLEEMYGVEIVYTEADIEKMYFIGKFSKSDSLSNILKQIASLNNLTISVHNNTYTITNKQ